uniref:E3 ubiquitin-protein ligase ZFP91 n=1 Tax=Gasterosteus aculeatus aculeatus TaxID=481459 RepID=A0AAQ4PN94_GASAC|nr:E3 ubiquitin-protein ligase ZFP91-like isoform X1 [Gasterosteus aculeatus aculeatus]
MSSVEDDVSGIRPGTETTGDSTEAAKPSPDPTEPSSGRRGSKRLAKTPAASPDSSGSAATFRVLRARAVGAGKSAGGNSKNAACTPTPYVKSVHRGRGRPRSKITPPAGKKSTSKNASKHTPGSKLPKASENKGRPSIQASRTTPATACKPEEEMAAVEETRCLKGINDSLAGPDAALDEDPPFRDDPNDCIYKPETKTERTRRNTILNQKEVKKEESEKEEEEEEEDDIKKEESTEIVVQCGDGVGDNPEPPRKRGRQQKDGKLPRLPKQRKKPPVQYVRCEIEGCGTVLAHPRYLQHHIKYQHLLKKKYVCDHPSCGRLFRLQKQLLRHAKHHTDQRDYICEYCARAFKSSHNLAVHRMIHTGEKPIQCEICGFTCRQKASLNWHMKKHDAESSYQFSCSICSKKFEKKDSVVAHKAKSHPEVLIAEALAANGGSVICSPGLIPEPARAPSPTQETAPELRQNPETVPVLTQSYQPNVGQENQGTSTLAPLQQVGDPLAPQTQVDGSLGQFLQLPTHHVVEVAHPQQAPTLLHLTAATPTNFSSVGHPQLLQLTALPACTAAPTASADPQSTLLTLSSVTTLASTASLASQQALQWGRETDGSEPLPGEGELWERVVVGGAHQDVGEMMWQGHEERRKEDEGIVWEREGARPVLLQCAEVNAESLI